VNVTLTQDQIRLTQRLVYWKPHIDRALKEGGNIYGFEDVMYFLLENKWYYFDNNLSFAIVQVFVYPNANVAHILIAGGDMKALPVLEEALDKFCKQNNITKKTIVGRKGFAKRLPKLGWKTPLNYYEKDV
jgi:hypothetical protein